MKRALVILLLSFSATLGAQQQRDFFLYAEMNGWHDLDAGDSTRFWGYGWWFPHNGELPITLPSPLLEMDKGDTAFIHFYNLSPEHHTIHLHGTDVDEMNDGAPHTTGPVLPNDSFVYMMEARDPGAYLYHCHVMTVQHVAMGMYGMLMVRNYPDTMRLYDNGPGFNKEYRYLMSDMDRDWNDNPISPGPFDEYIANYFMVNGLSSWQLFNDSSQVISALPGDSICLHVGNIGFSTIRMEFPFQLNARVYTSDARTLPAPFDADTLRIYPGERYGVVLKPLVPIVDYITVNYLNAILDLPMGVNYIGVNQYVHPSSVAEPGSKHHLEIFPNPAAEEIFLDCAERTELFISTIEGRVLAKQTLLPGRNRISCAGLAKGAYLFSTSGGRAAKVIVTH